MVSCPSDNFFTYKSLVLCLYFQDFSVGLGPKLTFTLISFFEFDLRSATPMEFIQSIAHEL